MTRKAIQISSPTASTLFALCDDGTIWRSDGDPGCEWHQVSPIPQPLNQDGPPEAGPMEQHVRQFFESLPSAQPET